jgi:hypothetical protein
MLCSVHIYTVRAGSASVRRPTSFDLRGLQDQNADKSMAQKMRELFLELHVMSRLNHPFVSASTQLNLKFP